METLNDLGDAAAPSGLRIRADQDARHPEPSADLFDAELASLQKLSVGRRERELRVLEAAVDHVQTAALCSHSLEAFAYRLQLLVIKRRISVENAGRFRSGSVKTRRVVLSRDRLIRRGPHVLELRESDEPIAKALPMNHVLGRDYGD